MTKQEAKELSLEVWRYLAEHPEIQNKGFLPKKIWRKIRLLRFYCPLCEVFKVRKQEICTGCPLVSCVLESSPFMIWSNAMDNEVRQEAAREIVRLIEAWEPEETK